MGLRRLRGDSGPIATATAWEFTLMLLNPKKRRTLGTVLFSKVAGGNSPQLAEPFGTFSV